MKLHGKPSACISLVRLSILICAMAARPQQTAKGAAQTSPSQFRVIRSFCGTKGITHGTEFEMQDPKSVFHIPEDHQIIVYFEWEGPPGSHHAVGSWRSPDGKVVLTSDFDLTSTGTQYRGTWTLAIPESIATGLWALEAQIDGQPAGTQTFEIAPSKNSAAPPPMPTSSEVYQRAAQASVFVTSLDEDRQEITRGFGFFIDKSAVITAFQVVDGASSVRLEFADGSSTTVNNLVAWNRREDWAILKGESAKVQPLEKAAPNSWKVGDLCYVLTSQGRGSRTIQNVNITGLQGTNPSSQRLTISALGAGGSAGAPVLDSYGRAIGVIGGGFADLQSRRMGSWLTYIDPGDSVAVIPNPTVLPLGSIPDSAVSQEPASLADLTARGILTMPLVRDPQAATGTFCDDFQKVHGEAIMPLRTKSEFSRSQTNLALVITWGPSEKTKSTQQLRIYDAENHALLQTAAAKIQLQPHVTSYSAWKVPIGSLQPGIYRVDVLVGDRPHWRQFFRLTD